MKPTNFFVCLCFGTLIFLTGCVGYNTTLFMTKSNAGLDFDAKPPTMELNISRKEGVVEPTFEGGKTPPVLASFGSKSGGFSKFFFGVDQTFAGGDAAVTMAKLYDDANKVPDGTNSDHIFDSGLPLSKIPEANKPNASWLSKWFLRLPEPGETRPFFFGTDTQLGVKVGWNGVGGAYPDNLKIGFSRKEISVAPVTFTPRETGANGVERANVVRIPSFLATVASDVKVGDQVELSWMQYFATGDSARFLARQYGVRKAMLQRADPSAVALSEAEKAGAKQHALAVDQAGEMVEWATSGGSLDAGKIEILIKDTDLKDRFTDIKSMSPAFFHAKLNSSWSVYVGALWANYPNKPKE